MATTGPSIKTMIQELDEHRQCHDIREYDDTFIGDMAVKLENANGDTRKLTNNQVEYVEKCYVRYIVGNRRA